MEEVRGAQKEVDFRRHLEGSPPKLDFGQGWGNVENEFMPRRSIWKGSFVDAFLLKKSFFISFFNSG